MAALLHISLPRFCFSFLRERGRGRYVGSEEEDRHFLTPYRAAPTFFFRKLLGISLEFWWQ